MYLPSPPFIWREALFARKLLPWLPPLDSATIIAKDLDCPPHSQWNWELLVRQLAQSRIREPGNGLHGLAPGLRNRRRIWQLVEDILDTKIRLQE